MSRGLKQQSAPASLPVSRGSAVDSELALLMRQFPRETTQFLDDLYYVDHGRYKRQQKDGKQLTVASRQPANVQSHYQATYYEKQSRPRSTKRPPPTPRDLNPPPMTFDTWQRSVFVPKDLAAAKTSPFKMEGQTELSKDKMDGKTSYGVSYTPKPLEGGGRVVEAAKADRRHDAKGGKFYDTTTTGEHFRQWQPQRNIQFGELPTFASSILYPTASRTLCTEMQDSFKGSKGLPAEAIKQDAPNIKLEGRHNFLTTNRETYTKQEAELLRPTKIRPQLYVDKRKPLMAVTQAMEDFPGYKDGKQPRPPRPVEPLQPTIDLKFDQKRYFDTEQRAIYRGHDILKNPVPDPFVPSDKTYKPPTEKFATTTITKSDFTPFAVEDNIQVRAQVPQPRQSLGGKFYDNTTNKDFFQDWTPQTKRRIRHGDFHEAYKYSIPAVYKLEGQSETKDSFIPMKAGEVINYKPEHKPIESSGEQLFDTEYKATYRGKKYHLNQQQAAQLKKILQQRKQKVLKANVQPVATVA